MTDDVTPPTSKDDMSHATRSPQVWTYADDARFPDDGNRYEVIDGEVLVTPAPTTRHPYVVGRL